MNWIDKGVKNLVRKKQGIRRFPLSQDEGNRLLLFSLSSFPGYS